MRISDWSSDVCSSDREAQQIRIAETRDELVRMPADVRPVALVAGDDAILAVEQDEPVLEAVDRILQAQVGLLQLGHVGPDTDDAPVVRPVVAEKDPPPVGHANFVRIARISMPVELVPEPRRE